MIIIISIITIILFAVLGVYTWQRLGNIEKKTKIIYIVLGLLIVAFITLILFNISSTNIDYEKIEMKNDIRKMLVLIFTPVNALFLMPSFAKILNEIKNDEIEKEKLKFRILKILIVFLIVLIIEYNYLVNTQIGILEIYKKQK